MHRFLFALALAVAARGAFAENMKIGYVDIQRAVQEVEEGKAARTRLQAELQQKRGDLEKKRADLEKMKADYDKQAPVLSDDAKRQRQEQLQKAFVDAQNAAGPSPSRVLPPWNRPVLPRSPSTRTPGIARSFRPRAPAR